MKKHLETGSKGIIKPWTRLTTLCLAVLVYMPAIGYEPLEPEQVLVLYNGQSTVSTAIKNAYALARPGVQVFDLNFSYTTPVNPANPAPTDVTPFEIHPEKFHELTNPSSPLGTYLAANPEILALVTTREIPGLVSTRFNIPANTDNNGYARSTESLLAALPDFDPENFPPPKAGTGFTGSEEPFGEFLKNNPGSPLRYLVSRLDSSGGDGMGPQGQTLALIDRSVELTVNKYAVTGLVDDWDEFGAGLVGPIQTGVWDLFWNGWCVEHETTCQFLHGPADPAFCPVTDGPFTADYPTLWLFTSGRHHNNPSQDSPCPPCSFTGGHQDPCQFPCEPGHGGGGYVRHYAAHPAGVFVSQESWNGFTIHRPGTTAGHGQVLDWIAAGGAFGIAHVAEPGSLDAEAVGVLLDRLYERGWTWGEAVWSGGVEVNWNRTPIGDPLARVRVFDPDLNGDHQVDGADLQILNDAMAMGTTAGDINGDGFTDQDDLDILNEVLGRICLPPVNTPCPNCKNDLNADGIVNGGDLALVLASQGSSSGSGDANCDGFVDGGDLAQILASWGSSRADVDQDGCVDFDDFSIVSDLTGLASESITILDPNWNPQADTNCDWKINSADFWFVANNQGLGCSTPPMSATGIGIDSQASDPLFFVNLVDTTSAPQSLVLKNTGELPGEIGAVIQPGAPFLPAGGTCGEAPFTLDPDESCSLAYTFSPTDASQSQDSMKYVRFNAGDIGFLGRTIIGIGVLVEEPVISVVPTGVNFGEVAVGTESDLRLIRIRSLGALELQVSAISDPGVPFERVEVPEDDRGCDPTPFFLVPGEVCILHYVFSPLLADEFDADVIITSNADPQDTIVILSGEGVR